MLTIQNYAVPDSLEEAYELNQKKTNIILGGTLWLKMGSRRVQTAIDLSKLGLDTMEESEDSFSIGAMCSLRQLETNCRLNEEFDQVFKKSLGGIVGVQFRNCATVGGSVFGRFGFSDVITCLLALDTQVELFQKGLMPLEAFLKSEKDKDVLVRIHIKKDGRKVTYLSQRQTKTDFPVIACGVSREENTFYASVGARPGRAVQIVREMEPESAAAPAGEKEAVKSLACSMAAELTFGSNMRGSAEYRRNLAEIYLRRALEELTGGEG